MSESEDGRPPVLCSFCGKRPNEARTLVQGPGVCICDECVDLSQEILEEETRSAAGKAAARTAQGPEQGLRCSFCGAGQWEPGVYLVAARYVCICGECVKLAADVCGDQQRRIATPDE